MSTQGGCGGSVSARLLQGAGRLVYRRTSWMSTRGLYLCSAPIGHPTRSDGIPKKPIARAARLWVYTYVLGEMMSSNSEVGSIALLGCVHRTDASLRFSQLAQIPRIAVQCPSHNLLQPANMVAHTVKVVRQMGLKRLLDHGPF